MHVPAYANICIHMHTTPPLWGSALGGGSICRCHSCPWVAPVAARMSLHMQLFAYTCTHVHTYENIDHAYASIYIHIHTYSCIYIPMPRHAYVHAYACPCRGMHMCMNLHAYVIPSLEGPTRPENGDPTHWGGGRGTCCICEYRPIHNSCYINALNEFINHIS